MGMRGDVTNAGRRTNDEQKLKIELLNPWKLEAECCKMLKMSNRSEIVDIINIFTLNVKNC